MDVNSVKCVKGNFALPGNSARRPSSLFRGYKYTDTGQQPTFVFTLTGVVVVGRVSFLYLLSGAGRVLFPKGDSFLVHSAAKEISLNKLVPTGKRLKSR